MTKDEIKVKLYHVRSLLERLFQHEISAIDNPINTTIDLGVAAELGIPQVVKIFEEAKPLVEECLDNAIKELNKQTTEYKRLNLYHDDWWHEIANYYGLPMAKGYHLVSSSYSGYLEPAFKEKK